MEKQYCTLCKKEHRSKYFKECTECKGQVCKYTSISYGCKCDNYDGGPCPDMKLKIVCDGCYSDSDSDSETEINKYANFRGTEVHTEGIGTVIEDHKGPEEYKVQVVSCCTGVLGVFHNTEQIRRGRLIEKYINKSNNDTRCISKINNLINPADESVYEYEGDSETDEEYIFCLKERVQLYIPVIILHEKSSIELIEYFLKEYSDCYDINEIFTASEYESTVLNELEFNASCSNCGLDIAPISLKNYTFEKEKLLFRYGVNPLNFYDETDYIKKFKEVEGLKWIDLNAEHHLHQEKNVLSHKKEMEETLSKEMEEKLNNTEL